VLRSIGHMVPGQLVATEGTEVVLDFLLGSDRHHPKTDKEQQDTPECLDRLFKLQADFVALIPNMLCYPLYVINMLDNR